MAAADRPVPLATYRLQFTKDFGFAAAARLAPYLKALGVSHVYASPYLKARPGSSHGYDIVSHNELNPELGDREDFERMLAAFEENGLGQILDFVPNHMGVGGADNPWWMDVLEWGARSRYAGWFDIDWNPGSPALDGKLLVPFLGEQYGAALASGALALRFAPETGSFAVWAYDTHRLPICPVHYGHILGGDDPGLERLGDAFAHLAASGTDLPLRAAELKSELAGAARDPATGAAIAGAVARFRGADGDIASWGALDSLIAKQHWRPAHFRVAADDVNYRRFFNINDLAGIRMELPELFDHAHCLVFDLVGRGALDGIRLDHIDGLFDPKAYCLRLREKAPRPIYLIVEKILAPHESLRQDWQVDGTTGYEFANLLTGLLVDPNGEAGLTGIYRAFTGLEAGFDEIVRAGKLYAIDNEMAAELGALARAAAAIARSNPMTADFTVNALRRALREVVTCFRVYRSYVDGAATVDDRREIDAAVAEARRREPALHPTVFDFLHGLLTGDLVAGPQSGFSRAAVIRFAMRAQQYSGPVMAKGLEDTAFYRYNRLLALNEVGGCLSAFGTDVESFHRANAERSKATPHAMLASSTHDTKRGEDARARLAVLSELPEDWRGAVDAWNAELRVEGEPRVDRNDEYAFYQLLLAAWPAATAAGAVPGAAELMALRPRLEGAMLKAVREAKVHTTWTAPDEGYEAAVLGLVGRALDPAEDNPFLRAFAPFARRIAALGLQNSLVATALKLTVPGVPDVYQGAELWDLSLVDPDNRRPVDYEVRRAFVEHDAAEPTATLIESWPDGRIKLRLVRRLLALRAAAAAVFRDGTYEPLIARGPAADRVVSFLRRSGEEAVIVAVARFPARGERGEDWTDTAIPLARELAGRRWVSLLDGGRHGSGEEALDPGTLFEILPAAVLVTPEIAERAGAAAWPR
jgi:(1->4)-alpha-D-glucan 1-alpha-D-glucosylmutase